MTPKPFYLSKTLLGALAMAASLVLQRWQVTASAEEISAALGQAADAFELLSGAAGFVMVIVGRIQARGPIRNPLGRPPRP